MQGVAEQVLGKWPRGESLGAFSCVRSGLGGPGPGLAPMFIYCERFLVCERIYLGLFNY